MGYVMCHALWILAHLYGVIQLSNQLPVVCGQHLKVDQKESSSDIFPNLNLKLLVKFIYILFFKELCAMV